MDAGGGIVILDWKRTKAIRFDNAFRQSLKEPLETLPDSNGWLYSLQRARSQMFSQGASEIVYVFSDVLRSLWVMGEAGV